MAENRPIARQSILTTLSSYIGVVIGYFNVLWLLPYVLEPSQIGLYRTIQDMALLLVPFAQLGLGNGITKYFPDFGDKRPNLLTLGLLYGFFGFLITTGLLLLFRGKIIEAFAENSPEVIGFLWVVILIVFFSVLNSILEAYCRSYYKIAVPTFFREIFNRLLSTILVTLYFFDWISFDQLIGLLSTIYFLSLVGMIFYMKKIKVFQLDFDLKVFPKGFHREFLKFCLISFMGATGAMLIMKIDSLMVTAMIGLDANAIYIIAFSIAIVIELPRRAISQISMPVIAEHFATGDHPAINQLYKKIAIHQLLLCLLLFLGIWANIDTLYHYVPNGAIYQTGKWVVLLIGLSKISDVLFSVNGEIILYSKYYLFNLTATFVMSVLTVLLNLWLIPIYGLEGAAMASLVAMLVFNLLKYGYVKYRLGFDPFTWDILKTAILAVLVFGIQWIILPTLDYKILDLLLRSLLITALYGLGIKFLKIVPESQQWFLEKIKGPRP